mgnify:CR=1 FL=1
MASWLFKVKILGLEIVLLISNDSKASSSSLRAKDPVLLRMPMPLVAPAIELFAQLQAAAPKVTPDTAAAAPPTIPEIFLPPLA